MRKNQVLNLYLILFILFVSIGLFSCSSTQKVKYFQDLPDTSAVKTIPSVAYIYPKILPGNILNITIQLLDPLATQSINSGNIVASPNSTGGVSTSTPNMSAFSGLGQQGVNAGYLVDVAGNIDIPVLGRIAAAGHTTAELSEIIKEQAEKYYKNPLVSVRLTNFNISITGEVTKPGVYTMPAEKVNIMNAIAMAGDLTIFGKRENVLLIRENLDGTKTAYRINLKKSDILSSPLYYMQQNDIVYVEPRKAKSDATDAAQQKYITIASAVLSLLIVLAYRVK